MYGWTNKGTGRQTKEQIDTTDRQKDRYTEGQTNKRTDSQKDRPICECMVGQKDRPICECIDRQVGRQADRQTGRQADRQTDIEMDRYKDRQTGREIDREDQLKDVLTDRQICKQINQLKQTGK
jgi:hypothetical protein